MEFQFAVSCMGFEFTNILSGSVVKGEGPKCMEARLEYSTVVQYTSNTLYTFITMGFLVQTRKIIFFLFLMMIEVMTMKITAQILNFQIFTT